MCIKTLSIEWKRTLPNVAIAALQSGTTDTALSKPFQNNVPKDKLLLINMPLSAAQLSDFRWKYRLLLLFAPDYQDPDLRQTRRAVQLQSCALGERDVIIGVFAAKGRSILDDQDISDREAFEVRQHFRFANGQFVALLIGKDGGEKHRSYTAPDLNAVFALIDGMPMPQQEMAANLSNCTQSEK